MFRWAVVFCVVFSGKQVFSAQYQLGLGVLPYHVMATTTDKGGGTALLSEIHFLAQFRAVWQLGVDSELSVRMAYTLIPRQAEDKAGDLTLALLSVSAGESFGASRSWRWYSGFGVFRHELRGRGGSVVLPNGNSTATFYRPGRTSASQVVSLEGGIGYQFLEDWRTDFELLAAGWLSERLTFSLLWTVSYTFGGGGL